MKKDSLLKAMLATLFLAFPTLHALANSFEVDGIYYTITSSDELTVEVTTNSNGYSGDITIPATVEDENGNTYSVTGIGDSAFSGCTGLTSVTLSEGLTYIDDFAFSQCTFTSVTIPSSVETIGLMAFRGTFDDTTLASVTFAENPQLTSIGTQAFQYRTALVSMDIPSSVTSIGGGIFQYCSSLESVTFGENSQLTTIGDHAFQECSSLKSITIPAGVITIEDGAFSGCSSLTSFVVEEGNTSYSSVNGVLYTSDLTKLLQAPTSLGAAYYEIPSSVTSIAATAFRGCTNLVSVTIPESVTSIGDEAFEDCSNLASIELSDSLTSMGRSMFSGCSSLASAKLPSGITSIPKWTFYNCSSLTSIEIPAVVDTIGNYAFYGCSSLDSITSLNPEPPVCVTEEGDSYNYYTFTGVATDTCVLTVPEGSKEAYAEANIWKEFVNIVDGTETEDEQGDDTETEGISAVAVDGQTNVSGYYTIDGKTVSAPAKGVNIVKFADGTTKKVLAK